MRTVNAQYNVAAPRSFADRVATRARREMFARFLRFAQPRASDLALDVGATSDRTYQSSNYFEALCPYRDRVVAVGLEPRSLIEKHFPGVRYICADGLALPSYRTSKVCTSRTGTPPAVKKVRTVKESLSAGLKVLERLHSTLVLERRMRRLAQSLGELLPDRGAVLDVGCGNGVIASCIMSAKPRVSVEGIDVLARPHCAIPMQVYDGVHFPYDDDAFDAVMFVDVLHHTDDPLVLLREAKRVARESIIVKDHLCNGPFAERVLRVMDWVGNRSHGVVLPYNYWSSEQWTQAWRDLESRPDRYLTNLGLYAWAARPLVEWGLHFIARIPVNKLPL